MSDKSSGQRITIQTPSNSQSWSGDSVGIMCCILSCLIFSLLIVWIMVGVFIISPSSISSFYKGLYVGGPLAVTGVMMILLGIVSCIYNTLPRSRLVI